MKYTNKNGFSEVIYNWLTNDEYDYVEGVLSTTTLLDPIRVILLKDRHWDELEMDVEDLIPARYGTAIHDSLEKSNKKLDNVRQEERVFGEIDGRRISGKFDVLKKVGDNHYRLGDAKSTSVYTYVFEDKYEKYSDQLSIYRWLLKQQPDFKDAEIDDTADIFLFFTDWSRKKYNDAVKRGETYPCTRLAEVTVPLATIEDTETWLKERINEIKKHENLEDDDLPRCTDEDLWRTKTKWAVYVGNKQRAERVLNSVEEAEEYIDRKGLNNAKIVKRPGLVKRCNPYCSARKFCNQYKEFVEQGLIENEKV